MDEAERFFRLLGKALPPLHDIDFCLRQAVQAVNQLVNLVFLICGADLQLPGRKQI